MNGRLARVALVLGAAIGVSALWSAAEACACCSNQGWRHVGSERYADTYASEVERVAFAPGATLFTGEGEAEDIPGIADPASDYVMSGAWGGERLVLTLTAASGATGTISLAKPETISVFEVDPREITDGNADISLYKEWKLTGAVEATGAFAASAGEKQRLTLILQGRGNNCGAAEDFTAWTLVMEGPNANYTLFGTLVRTP
jgi:hypothetical protein